MAKNINMTRERKIALPVILEAARRELARLQIDSREGRALYNALEAFK